MASVTAAEVRKHNTQEDIWIVVHGNVYDISKFLPDHPGGVQAILRYAGQDATEAFDVVHPKNILQQLPVEALVGPISAEERALLKPREEAPVTPVVTDALPPLDHCLNMFDFEAVARRVMKKDAWDYYSSGADDEITLRENHAAFQRLWLRPRVMVNVKQIDFGCRILGNWSSFPVYLTACALGKLAHPEGEVVLTRAAAAQSVIQMFPTLASCSLDEMIGARAPDQVFFFQLYVNSDRKVTEAIVRKAEAAGCKALCITVDAPQLGRREKDMRNKFSAVEPSNMRKDKSAMNRNQGTARAISAFIDPALCWDDLKWFRSITKMPIVLKGVQCGEDAVLAAQRGVDAIILSNHGGRQLDSARSGVEILVEVMAALRAAKLENKIEVWIDGGVRRGTDIFKALALGAKAVGIGRPALYAMAGYGQDGVERMLQLLKDELEMVMRLMGTPTLADIKPDMILTKNVGDHFVASPSDSLSLQTYVPMQAAAKL